MEVEVLDKKNIWTDKNDKTIVQIVSKKMCKLCNNVEEHKFSCFHNMTKEVQH